MRSRLFLLLAAGLLTGCATLPPGERDPRDRFERFNRAIFAFNDALDRGGRVLTGGPALDNATGQFYPPTVIADVPSDALAATEETFGPLAVLIRFHSEAEAIAIANDTRAGLAAYVYTRDQSRGWRVSEALDYGMVGLNTGLFSSEMAPFGGMKESGFGREGSYLGLQDYLEIKSICVEVASAGQV
jgi:succinate-semialdehyde dehydrogenase/glutarate-semialdehyde dehydrogenase